MCSVHLSVRKLVQINYVTPAISFKRKKEISLVVYVLHENTQNLSFQVVVLQRFITHVQNNCFAY